MTIDNTTHDQLEQRLSAIDWTALTNRAFMASPKAWEDQVLYFMMLDRFSDGREKGFRDNAGNLFSRRVKFFLRNVSSVGAAAICLLDYF